MECLRLRIKDVDFEASSIFVRDTKSNRDRVTVLPDLTRESLRAQIDRALKLHQQDLANGRGRVYLPHSLAEKYPNANRELAWQYVFPSHNLASLPRRSKDVFHSLSMPSLRRRRGVIICSRQSSR